MKSLKRIFNFLIIFAYLFLSQNAHSRSVQIATSIDALEINADNFLRITADPLWGQLVCRPIFQWNLQSGSYEPILVRGVQDLKGADKSSKWIYTLRTGLSWGDGEVFNASHLEQIIKDHLPKVIRKNLPQIKADLPFEVQATSQTLTISWPERPPFGPYILAQLPITKKRTQHKTNFSDDKSQVCVGKYTSNFNKGDWLFTLKGDSNHKLPREIFLQSRNKKTSKDDLFLTFAASFDSSPKTRLSDEASSCSLTILAPFVTLISWNVKNPLVDHPKIREILTTMLPRGELLRAGSGFLGELLSAPIPRWHPGYDQSLAIRPFDLQKAADSLTAQGLVRSTAHGPRLLAKSGAALALRIGVDAPRPGLMEKVIGDSFAAVGIELQFDRMPQNTEQGQKYSGDGVLSTLRIDSQQLSYLSLLHSQHPTSTFPLNAIEDPSFDQAWESYALSLTQQRPDANFLKKVHQVLYRQEYISTLFQHKFCVEGAKTMDKMTRSDNFYTNPAWFVNLLM